MSPEDAAAELRRALLSRLGKERVAELASEIDATAGQLAMVLGEPVALDDEDPDFMGPPAHDA